MRRQPSIHTVYHLSNQYNATTTCNFTTCVRACDKLQNHKSAHIQAKKHQYNAVIQRRDWVLTPHLQLWGTGHRVNLSRDPGYAEYRIFSLTSWWEPSKGRFSHNIWQSVILTMSLYAARQTHRPAQTKRFTSSHQPVEILTHLHFSPNVHHIILKGVLVWSRKLQRFHRKIENHRPSHPHYKGADLFSSICGGLWFWTLWL